MKKALLVLLIAILGIAGYYWYMFSRKSEANSGPKQEALKLKKHSDKFNQSVTAAMGAYFDIAGALVDADTAKAKTAAANFVRLLDSIPMDELKKDTTNIYETAMGTFGDIKSNAADILAVNDLQQMRQDFSNVSENLYPTFFNVINYEGETLYWQNCPMAFGDGKEANWVSKSEEVVNPYLGKNHPEFKATMLHCGSVKATIKAK